MTTSILPCDERPMRRRSHSPRVGRRSVGPLLGLLLLASTVVGAPDATAAEAGRQAPPLVSVIVRSAAGTAEAHAAVVRVDGSVTRELDIIDGVSAAITPEALAALRSRPDLEVTENVALQLHGSDSADISEPVRSERLREIIGADDLLVAGNDGSGIGVALIDTGVTEVAGIAGSDVLHGPDLSVEAGSPALATKDTNGHGTHLAGIISSGAEGVAPGATIVSVKVADAWGNTDVSQVIAAIGWVIEHKDEPDLNIRVLNLAFGTDSTQDYRIDPLSFAVEQAIRAGIVVVAAAGNDGIADGKLDNPAHDPHVIAVAAVNTKATETVEDDTVPSFSSRGDGIRNPDVAAPGVSIVSARVPGSYIDVHHGDTGVFEQQWFRGSGTSQATAVTAGAAALLLDAQPHLSPVQVKRLLMRGARKVPQEGAIAAGHGLIDVSESLRRLHQSGAPQSATAEWSTGTGSLEASRGGAHVMEPVFDENGELTGWHELTGELTAFGTEWNAGSWSAGSWSAGSWSGGSWSGGSWSGGSWSGGSWSGGSWSGGSWSAGSWSGGSWSGGSWSAGSWSGGSWSSFDWSTSLWQ